MDTLFQPYRLNGTLTLANRFMMAPLTRCMAGPGLVPTAQMAAYYGRRADIGLIISEATIIRPDGQGYPNTPGIYSPEQIAGWKQVTEAVHAKGGKIFAQLWHVGRLSHPFFHHTEVLAPSAVAHEGTVPRMRELVYQVPRALTVAEIGQLVEDYAQAAANAIEAGFDGVEIHGANGYLLEQFLQRRSNQRGDAYGGSIEHRSRIVLEVAEAVLGVFGADRVGIRLSPFGVANGSGEDEPMPLYSYLVRSLAALDLAYLHLIEPRASGAGQAEVDHQNVPFASELFRPLWPNVLIAAGNYTPASAAAAIESGRADAIAFGRLFIANPDLPERARIGASLNPYLRATFYGGGAEGYTDYPSLIPAA